MIWLCLPVSGGPAKTPLRAFCGRSCLHIPVSLKTEGAASFCFHSCFPIRPRPPGKLPASIRRPLTKGSMGISPLRGSLRAVPIACSCGWTEVSLSLVCFIALPVVARLSGMTGIPAPLLMVSFVTAFAAEASSRVSLWLEVSLPYRNVPDGPHIQLSVRRASEDVPLMGSFGKRQKFRKILM